MPQLTSEAMLAKLQREYGSAQFNQEWISQDWVYWDKVYYGTSAAGLNSYTFFAVPAGGVDPNAPTGVRKTNEDTNLQTQNQISGQECFIVTHVQTDIRLAPKARQTGTGVSTDDSFSARQLPYARFFKKLSGMGVLFWEINSKKWLIEDSPFLRFAPGWGLGPVYPPVVSYTTSGGAAVINNGANAYLALSPYDIDGGSIGDPFSLGQPVFLAPNTNFNVTIASVIGSFPTSNSLMGPSTDQSAILQLMVALRGWKVRPRS